MSNILQYARHPLGVASATSALRNECHIHKSNNSDLIAWQTFLAWKLTPKSLAFRNTGILHSEHTLKQQNCATLLDQWMNNRNFCHAVICKTDMHVFNSQSLIHKLGLLTDSWPAKKTIDLEFVGPGFQSREAVVVAKCIISLSCEGTLVNHREASQCPAEADNGDIMWYQHINMLGKIKKVCMPSCCSCPCLIKGRRYELLWRLPRFGMCRLKQNETATCGNNYASKRANDFSWLLALFNSRTFLYFCKGVLFRLTGLEAQWDTCRIVLVLRPLWLVQLWESSRCWTPEPAMDADAAGGRLVNSKRFIEWECNTDDNILVLIAHSKTEKFAKPVRAAFASHVWSTSMSSSHPLQNPVQNKAGYQIIMYMVRRYTYYVLMFR